MIMNKFKKVDVTALKYLCSTRDGESLAALMLWAKVSYVSSVIKGYNATMVAKQIGAHKETVKRAVRRGIALGLCALVNDEKDLLFYNMKGVVSEKQRHRGMDISPIMGSMSFTMRGLKDFIRFVIFADLQRRTTAVAYQASMRNSKKIKSFILKQKRREKKGLSFVGEDKGLHDVTAFSSAISFKRTARELGVGMTTAQRLIRKWVEEGLIKKIAGKIERISTNGRYSSSDAATEKARAYLCALESDLPIPSGVFSIGRFLYYQNPNEYVLSF